MISIEYDDFPINNMIIYKFGDNFPILYLQQYCYSFTDYKDRTLLAILYAIQNGFPLNDLSRAYKNKIKKLLEGGNRILFDEKTATQIVNKTIFTYFLRRDRKNIVHFR